MSGSRNGGNRRERGLALVVVLWAAVILTLMAAGVSRLSRDDVAQTRALEARLRADLAAESGIAAALHGLAQGAWEVGEAARRISLDEAEAIVTVTDEAGRIDLNTADPRLFEALLLGVGAADGAARSAARRVADAQEQARAREDGPPAFGIVEEVLAFPEIEDAIFTRIEEALTVHTGAPAPVAEVAPAIVREALAVQGPLAGFVGGEGEVVRILSEARTDAGAVSALRAVVMLREASGVQTLFWGAVRPRFF